MNSSTKKVEIEIKKTFHYNFFLYISECRVYSKPQGRFHFEVDFFTRDSPLFCTLSGILVVELSAMIFEEAIKVRLKV